MASIVRDPGGRKRIQFQVGGHRQATIYLGKVELRHAETRRSRPRSRRC